MIMKIYVFVLVVGLLTGCGRIYTNEIVQIANQCGGVDKINRIWIDVQKTKAYCNDGKRAGEW